MRPIPDLRDGAVRLWLPEGFGYRSFHDTEFPVRLDDGTALPGRHDGMGDPAKAYDPKAQGGCTTIEVTRFGEVVRAHTSLNGTQMNCSCGQMPWGTWISCEETINGPDVGPDFTGVPNIALTQRHGFIFEVPLTDEARQRRAAAGARRARPTQCGPGRRATGPGQ